MPAENTVNYISNKHTEHRFLWVEFQLKAICEQVSDYGIEETLRNIPEDIHDTYERILDIINRKPPAQRELARKALLFVAYSRKPVLIDVLALAIAAKDHTQSLDIFRSSISTEKIILHACGNLLSTDNDGHACFVHFSVQEFLISGRSKFVHAFSLEYEMAHREIARMCMIFVLILYSHVQDYSSDIEYNFTNDYILHALPFHLLDGNLNSLSSNDEMITLTSLFFETSPPMLVFHYSLLIFSPSVLALIFNLPGTYQCYDPGVLHREQLDLRVLVWIYERERSKFNRLLDNRLAMHYAIGSLDSVAACQRLYNHRYPIEFFYSDSDTLNTTTHRPDWIPIHYRVTPFYLVRSVEVARFLLDRGASVNPQHVNSELPSLFGCLAQGGNTEVMKFLFDYGAELEDMDQGIALATLASNGKVEAIRMLLDNGVNINIQGADNYYNTLLQAAAHGGYVRAIQLFLDEGADVNVQGGEYGNALQAAASEGSIEAMQLLLDRGADVNAQGGFHGNALQAVAIEGSTEAIQLLLDRGADVSAQGGEYGNALQAAAFEGSIESIQIFLDKGADVNVQSGYYGNALQAAASKGRIEAIQLLLDKGADFNVQGGFYGNALQAAASKGSIEAIQLLLDRGADVNAQGGFYGNALQAAASNGRIEDIQLLLDKGADVNAQGGKYGNALQAAAFIRSIEVIQFLVDKRADVNAQGGEYGNALQIAAYNGHIRAVRLFLDKGADVNAQGGKYGNALQAAAYNGNIKAMRRLLDKGADVNAQGGEYGNALQAAGYSGYSEAIQFLLDKGADVHAQGGKYGNALQAALVVVLHDLRHLKSPLHTAEILLDHGADITAYVAGSPHGDALSAAKELWKDDKDSLAKFMKLLELKGWKEGKSGTDENGPQV